MDSGGFAITAGQIKGLADQGLMRPDTPPRGSHVRFRVSAQRLDGGSEVFSALRVIHDARLRPWSFVRMILGLSVVVPSVSFFDINRSREIPSMH